MNKLKRLVVLKMSWKSQIEFIWSWYYSFNRLACAWVYYYFYTFRHIFKKKFQKIKDPDKILKSSEEKGQKSPNKTKSDWHKTFQCQLQ